MKLIPASRAFAIIRDEVASSVGPPNIMVPRQIGEIFRPLRPSLRYCISFLLHRSRHSGAMRSIEPGISRFRVWSFGPSRNDGLFIDLVLQYLEHTARHRDTALVDGHLRRDENQAA